ncbi:hypothetical protein ACIQ64_30935 [Streptomyces sp. NPDC094473]|uniref:hypothetical protein n=1 Tax=unclassified Streptomyces TaxID=2593676 RepID=UPI0038001A01
MSPNRTTTPLTSHAPQSESDLLPRWTRFAPLVLVVLGLAIGLPTPGAYSGDVFLILSSMIAACVYSLRAVVWVAALKSVAGPVFLLVRHLPSDGRHAVVDYVALVVLAWATVPLCRLRLFLRDQLLGAQRVAESAQRAVLPPVRSVHTHTDGVLAEDLALVAVTRAEHAPPWGGAEPAPP